MRPLISFVIPVYNAEKHLDRCLISLLGQTIDDWEVVCIDDGSNDRSGEILDRYARGDTRIKVVHQDNHGVSLARNIGLLMACGDWISFVDADDWIESNYIESFCNCMPSADIYFLGCKIHYSDLSCKIVELPNSGKECYKDTQGQLFASLANLPGGGDAFGWTWNKIYCRTFLERYRVLFPVNISYFEDEIFALQACRNALSVYVIPGCLYHYHENIKGGGLTAKGINSEDKSVVIDAFINLVRTEDPPWLKKIAYTRAYHFILNQVRKTPSWYDSRKLFNLICDHGEYLPKVGHLYKLSRMLRALPEWMGGGLIMIICKVLTFMKRN